MRDNKNRTENHSPEYTDAKEELFSAAPEYAPVGQEFAYAAPEFMEPADSTAHVPEEFKEGKTGEADLSSGKSKHRLLRKAGYLITAAAVAVTLATPGMNLWSGMFIEAENASSVGNEPEESEETAQPTPEPEMTAQPTPEPEETVQSTPEPEQEEEAPISFIFSDMPVAAYEVTGLGVGRFESVNEGELLFEFEDYPEDNFYINLPFVRLTPGENTFVLLCMQRYEDDEGYSLPSATIHSPPGSSQWEAITYEHQYVYPPKTLGDFSVLERRDTNSEYSTYAYNEETFGGGFIGVADPTSRWIQFAEIYHPDSQQDDTIYIIQAYAFPGAKAHGYDKIENVFARMADTFEELGATTVKEIPVEEALKRCNVVVSEGDAD